jgi:phosphopantothenoylcysteine decarboxylase/phosphopantothenate--cysteine ligase
MRESKRADLIILAAAVADWRPARLSRRKIKKGTEGASIALVENPDILAELGARKKPHQTLVGFALETNDLEKNARAKLKRKRCDWIVANDVRAISAAASRAILMNAAGKRIVLPKLPKEDLALLILSHVLG